MSRRLSNRNPRIFSSLLIFCIFFQFCYSIESNLTSSNVEDSLLHATTPTKATTTDATTTRATTKINYNYISYEKWQCGATDFDKQLSHQLAEESCRIRMYEGNLCCLTHDLCYMELDKTQKFCDAAFCFCLTRTVAEAARALNTSIKGCQSVANTFCTIVEVFGEIAYENARASLTSTTAFATTSTKTSTTTTTASRTTSARTESTKPSTISAKTTVTPQTPAKMAQFVMHNISLQCFDYQLTSCVEKLHGCVWAHENERKALLNAQKRLILSQRTQIAVEEEALANAAAFCSTQFCACVSKRSTGGSTFGRGALFVEPTFIDVNAEKKMSAECDASVELMCREFRASNSLVKLLADNEGDSNGRLNIHFWSVNAQYLGYAFDLTTAFFSGFFALMAFILFAYVCLKLYTICSEKRRNADVISGTRPDFISSCTRRHTLTKHDSKAGYNVFGDKESSSSSTVSGYTGHKQQAFPHNRFHNNNKTSNNNALKPCALMPTSSSKTQLISADENSSASTPSINSAT